MIPKPVVSLHGNGESVTLTTLASTWVLMQGSTGLGWGPQEITTAALAIGGSVLRHRRTGEAEVMVPFLIGGATESERWEQRRSLERLCDGRVEIRVETRDDTRSRFGYYKDGLQGDYGPGEDSPDGQKIALTFLCPDPFWYSQERSTVRQLVGLRKPFLSKPDENGLAAPFFPVILDSSTIEGEFVFDIAGDVEAWPTWHVTGPGADLLIENKFTGDRIFVSGEFREPVTIVTRPQVQDITSEGATAGELWDRVSLDSALFPLVPGKNEISISMVGASAKSSVRMSYRERFKAGY